MSISKLGAEQPKPWLVVADGEGSADTRICRTHAEIVQFLWEQCGHDYTGNEEHARNAWFAYLEEGDNWQSRDGSPQFRCEIDIGETGRIEIQWMGEAGNSFASLSAMNEKLVTALEKYGHRNDCDMKLWRERAVKASCTCGFDALLAQSRGKQS